MMKRIIAILLLVVIGMTMVACAPDACEFCGAEDVKLKKVKEDGETAWLCPSCKALYDLGKSLGY